MDGQQPARPGKLEQILAVASTLVMAWFMLPEHQRRLAVMRTAAWLRLTAGRLARAEGQRGMGDELAGRDPLPRYGAAFVLASCRDRLSVALERMRP